MEWFDHTDTTREHAKRVSVRRIQQIRVYDLSVLPGVIFHPTMKNITYFMVEYARALQLDMTKYPDKYKGASFDYVYEKMATAIVNNKAIVKNSKPIQHACRAAGIPTSAMWIQTYIWFDQPVNTREVVRYQSKARKSPKLGGRIVAVKGHRKHVGKLASLKSRYADLGRPPPGYKE